MTQGFAATLAEDDTEEFDKLREESRQEVPPAPEPGRTSSPDPATAPTPPSPPTAEELIEAKRVVPEAVFLEQKKERQRLEKLVQEQADRQARLEERYKQIEERMKPPPAPLPDRATDPVGYLEHEIAQTKAPVQTLVEKLNRFEQQAQAQQQEAQLAMWANSAEQEFGTKQADYLNAVDHLRAARMKQYELAGLPPEQHALALRADTRNWLLALAQSGRDPAEATYELARAYGYSGAAPADPNPVANGAGTAPEKPRDPNTGQFLSKPPDPRVERKKEALKTVARGQEAAKSLGDAPGASPDNGLPDPDELMKMSDEDFDKWTSGKNWKKFWN